MRRSYTVVVTEVRSYSCQIEAASSEQEAIAMAHAEVSLGQWTMARSRTVVAMANGLVQRAARLVPLRAAGR